MPSVTTQRHSLAVAAALLLAPGTGLYFHARREHKLRVFSAAEWCVFGAIALAALVALSALVACAIVV